MALPSDRNAFTNLFPDMRVNGVDMMDFWRAWQMSVDFRDKVKDFDQYILQEGDRWDTVAEKFYGDRQLWWVLALYNEVENPFEIYFNKTISTVKKSIRLIRQSDVSLLTTEIRRKRIQFENEKFE